MRRLLAHKKFKRVLIVCGTIVFVLGALFGSVVWIDASQGTAIARGVRVGHIPVGGLEQDEAYDALVIAIDSFERDGLIFEIGDNKLTVGPQALSDAGPDYSYTLYEFNPEDTVDKAFDVGRESSLIRRLVERFRAKKGKKNFTFSVDLDREQLRGMLEDAFMEHQSLMLETSLAMDFSGDDPLVSVRPGAPGRALLYDKAIDRALYQMQTLDRRPIKIAMVPLSPSVSVSDAQSLIPRMNKLLEHKKLSFAFEEKKWEADREKFASWIALVDDNQGARFSVFEGEVNKFLDTVASDIEVESQDAKFEIKDGKVAAFQASHNGLSINRDATIENIKSVFIEHNLPSIPIVTLVSEPSVTTKEVNEYGITELIAEGRTNFSGSPRNRRHNIKTGINLISGSLLKPGEEFSTLSTLGKIDGSTGFKSELVIKGNETKPEFGGGLCQVSTTLFRATLNSGLPVTQRRNHSYRVPYYEPPIGKDATIYSPAPDYKFVNDTGNHILILGRVEGNDAVFEFWGTKDGRTVEQTDPVVYNIKPPPEKKVILTTDLEPGEEKCTESPHAGASANFDYNVTYATGEVKEETFYSRFRPWGAVCLKGATEEEIIEDEAKKTLEEEAKTLESAGVDKSQ